MCFAIGAAQAASARRRQGPQIAGPHSACVRDAEDMFSAEATSRQLSHDARKLGPVVLAADDGRDLVRCKPFGEEAQVAGEGRRRFGRVMEKRLDPGVLRGTEIAKVERRDSREVLP